MVPTEKEGPAPAPVVTVGQCEPGTRLADCWALQPHRAARNKSTGDVGGFTLPAPQKARGKERTFPAPTPPLTCILLPTTSVITTNKNTARRQTETLLCSHDDDSPASKIKKKGSCIQKTLQKNLRAHSCTNINEQHIDSNHIQDTYGACC